jgi:hypothetical protein
VGQHRVDSLSDQDGVHEAGQIPPGIGNQCL